MTRWHEYSPQWLPHRFFRTAKYRMVIGLIVFVFIATAGFIFFIYPQKGYLGQLIQKVTVTEKEIRTKRSTAIQQQKLLTLQQHLQQTLTAFYIAKPDYLVTTQMITQIEQWSKQQGLQLNNVGLGELKSETHLILQPVNIDFTGTYKQFMSLFQFLGEHYAALDMVEFTMQKQNRNVDTYLSLKLKLHIVILKT